MSNVIFNSAIHMRSKVIHPILAPSYSLRNLFSHYPTITWDVRYSASTALLSSGHSISSYWNIHATSPPSNLMRLVFGTYPLTWHIEVRNMYGVTIRDILSTIYRMLHIRLTSAEWSNFSHHHRSKVWSTLSRRVSESIQWRYRHTDEARRVDTLLKRTSFAGLSRSRGEPHTWIVNLRQVYY